MEIRLGTPSDREKILLIRPQAADFIDGDYLVVAEEDGVPLGFATVFVRKIPAPIDASEAFINVIDVLDETRRNKGIASAMIEKIAQIERERKSYQLRAYCDIGNSASHSLWLKNKFGISPVKMPDGNIVGSYVTLVL
ncbi:MAG: GNAT family N-acetyltransferase [Bacteroides sp.]|nr:GNAT family N-acetyltransferase [Eubacterium sp.]MCM1417163.1 GNAT family N-acetyltransferase [Roseburia sp.]MCM1461216.1 GNAT family N-acetyltransferase [Bacteroides sp.]